MVTENVPRQIYQFEDTINMGPLSPNLIHLDFFLWGYCKYNIYKDNTRPVADLNTKIQVCIRDQQSYSLECEGEFFRRLRVRIEQEGPYRTFTVISLSLFSIILKQYLLTYTLVTLNFC